MRSIAGRSITGAGADPQAVRLTDERLAHVRSHPEMIGLGSAIDEVLRHPERVIESSSDPHVRLYYGNCEGTRVGDKWLCVVVKLHDGEAFVLTAYLTDTVKKGRRRWPGRS